MKNKQRNKASHYRRREANTGRGAAQWEPPRETLIALNLLPDVLDSEANRSRADGTTATEAQTLKAQS